MTVGFRHRLEYAALRTAMAAANLMPEAVAYRLVAAAGRLFFRCSKRRQRVALRMLRNAYPDRTDRELLALGRLATGNMFKVGLDMLRLDRVLARGTLWDRVDITGFGDPPKPPFLGLTAHLGSWEVAAVAAGQRFGGVDVVTQTIRNPLVQRFLEASRGRAGLRLHPRRGGIRGLARVLARGGIGLQAVDQNQRLRGVFAPFFGELASTERAAATLAVRNGYPLVVGGAVRIGTGFRFRIIFDLLARPPLTGDRERDVEALVCAINAAIEALVRRYPEQYFWIHDRYRTRPRAPAEPEQCKD